MAVVLSYCTSSEEIPPSLSSTELAPYGWQVVAGVKRVPAAHCRGWALEKLMGWPSAIACQVLQELCWAVGKDSKSHGVGRLAEIAPHPSSSFSKCPPCPGPASSIPVLSWTMEKRIRLDECTFWMSGPPGTDDFCPGHNVKGTIRAQSRNTNRGKIAPMS